MIAAEINLLNLAWRIVSKFYDRISVRGGPFQEASMSSLDESINANVVPQTNGLRYTFGKLPLMQLGLSLFQSCKWNQAEKSRPAPATQWQESGWDCIRPANGSSSMPLPYQKYSRDSAVIE
ncbi:hypothetical protein TNIN_307921 [Trichonephila inaurata madagascariensis]|uniref:Uncharacterized protein n=1 Tax=Trichonephila inaurata madagascariensis TaxID=2747483 RepID=A0A8X6XRE0_9ARAC|nr:hypothetical protein TNIN_307921 [Trichonephila inaurata madagascariensis]